ncbi:MAG: GGDEF domain-containing protein [Lachnospiraceae bacterium]|nr:GGDEF domain-containing protein [Lachnospiraceae bacterium]
MKNILDKTIGGSYERKLPVINIKRCTVAAVLLSIFIPAILITNIVFLNQTLIRPEYNKYLFSILIFSVIFLFIRVIVGNTYEHRRYYGIIYRSYLVLCSGFMIMLCNSYFELEGSLFYFFLIMIFFAIIPIFNVGELIFAEIISISLMGYLIWSNKGVVTIASQVLIFNFARIAVTIWKYILVSRNIRMKLNTDGGKELVTKDKVTGYLNQQGLNRRMEIVWEVCRRNKVSCGAIVLDVESIAEDYKVYGFDSMEECLGDIADNVRKLLRDKTDIYARTGKYKFTIIVHDTERTELVLMAKKLQYSLECGSNINMGIVLLKDTRRDSYANILNVANNSLELSYRANIGAIAYGRTVIKS